MNEAYVLLNVDHKLQKDVVKRAQTLPAVKTVKTVYGIYDLMIILESEDMGAIKKTIDVDIHEMDGITNMTFLVTMGLASAIFDQELPQEFEIVIVGAGPAGLTAGIYVARQNVSCLIISKDLGGQMNLIPKLENYPGNIMSSGPILAKILETQYLAFKGQMVFDTVEKIDEFEDGFKIKTNRSEYIAKAVVLGPGKVPNMLGLENESKYYNKGIHYCTKCDAPFYQGKITASIGVGAYLLESGMLLSRMASKIYLILKGTKLGGDKEIIAALENNKNIEIIPQSSVKSISGNTVLQHVTIVDSSGAEKTLDVDGLFIEMGSKINLDFVKHLVKINTKGEIEIESGGSTSHPGIFAAGDGTTIPYKQIVVACGDGSNAGLSAFNYIEKLKGRPGVRADWKKQIGSQTFHY